MAPLKPLFPPTTTPPGSSLGQNVPLQTLLLNNFQPSSWFLLAASLQGLLTWLFPTAFTFIPAVLILAYRGVDVLLMTYGLKSNPAMDGVITQKFSAQIPDEDGDFGDRPSRDSVVVLLLGSKSNHPLGILSPGFKKVGDYFNDMAKDLEANREEYGYLTSSSYISNNDETHNAARGIMTVYYFRSMDGLHKFANAPAHRAGWNWWNRTVKEHPHISIMHEVYEAPAGAWESIYVNYKPIGLGMYPIPIVGLSWWIWYICYIWCLKGVLLCLYWKLTAGTWHRHLVVGSSGFCVVIWLACLLTHVCMCTPTYRNWQIQPYPGDHCTLRQPLYVEIAVFNVLSDICIIVIPIPILMKLQVPLPRKIVLALMFSSGFFIMICTILRAYYSLASITSLPIALGWASRECFVAAIVASLPGIKPLFRNTKILGSSNRKKSHNYYNSQGYNNFGSKASANTKTFASRRRGSRGGNFELDSVLQTGNMDTRVSTGDSEEYILESAKHEGSSTRRQPNDDLAIHVTTEYSLQTEHQR